MSYLHRLAPELTATLPKLKLGQAPTPVRPLTLPGAAATEVWLKDESAFGDGGWGGNKVRKLEWLLPEVKRRRRGSVLTFGGLGTNWGLAVALYGREQGLKTALALVGQPRDEHVEAQLGRLAASGAAIHFTRNKFLTAAALPWLLARHSHRGRPPLILPVGGSSALGLLGYVEGALELAAQVDAGDLPEPELIVVPVGSGGTAAGLMLGLALSGLKTRVLGVVVSDQPRLDPAGMTSRAAAAARLLRKRGYRGEMPRLDPDRIRIVRDWLGVGYGHPTDQAAQAIEAARRSEGLVLDPVYTGKAMAALDAMAGAGSLGPGPVVFLNTNGPR